MASPLISMAQSLLTPELVSRVGAQTGESDSSISKAFGGVIPLVFAALANQSDNRGLMSQVADLASRAPGDAPEILGTVIGGSRAPASIDPNIASGAWLSTLLPSGTSSLADALARYAGIRSSSASSLVALAGPIVLACIGRLMRSVHLDANGLSDRLRSDRHTLASSVPSGLEALLPSFTRTHTSSRLDTRTTPPTWRPSAAAWVLPLVLGAVLLAGLFYWRVRDRAAQRIGTAGHVASSPVGTMGSTDLFTRRLPGNFAVQVPRRGMEDRLLDYLSTPSVSALNRQFDFDRIAFNTGSATLTEPSREQLANIAAILRAYPNTQVSIDGYTDNAGDEATDTALSRARATAVMDTLRDMGVPSTQMRAEGYGSRNPVADNISEQGRARNRRVVLEVTSH